MKRNAIRPVAYLEDGKPLARGKTFLRKDGTPYTMRELKDDVNKLSQRVKSLQAAGQGTDVTITFDPGEIEFSATTSDPGSMPEVEYAGYSLRGWFQGREYTIEDIQWDDSPIELVMRRVLGLEDGDELQSFLVKTKDGASDIRSLPE